MNNDRTVPRQDLTTKASEFSNFVSIYQFENSKGGLTKGLDAVSVAIKEIPDRGENQRGVAVADDSIEPLVQVR